MSVRVNLGSGWEPREGWVNVDLFAPADVRADLTQRFPFGDESVDEVYSSHLLEHLPSFAHFMNECWRILKPGCTATIIVPIPSDSFWRDPSHVRPYTRETFEVYCCVPQGSLYGCYLGLETWSKADVTDRRDNFNGTDQPVIVAVMTK